MIKKGFAPLLILALLFGSCAEKIDGYQINGKINGLENQKILLEYFGSAELTVIDSATLDANGKFTMEGNVDKKGFYRISNGTKFWVLLLENTKMGFDADANDDKLLDIKISNYKEGVFFQEAVNFLVTKQTGFSEEMKKMQTNLYSPEITPEERLTMQADFEKYQATLMTQLKEETNKYLETSPLSSVYLLSSLGVQGNELFFKETVAKLESKLPDSEYVQNLKEMVAHTEEQKRLQEEAEAKAKSIDNAGTAPEIIMNNPAGEEMKLSDLKGKVVLVDFWASWCKPCRAENPNVVRMYHQYKNKGFDIFSVSLDRNMDAWEKAIAKDGLVWNSHVSDLKFWQNAAAKDWGVTTIPATFLLDKDGNIIAKNLRGTALEAKLKEVL